MNSLDNFRDQSGALICRSADKPRLYHPTAIEAAGDIVFSMCVFLSFMFFRSKLVVVDW